MPTVNDQAGHLAGWLIYPFGSDMIDTCRGDGLEIRR